MKRRRSVSMTWAALPIVVGLCAPAKANDTPSGASKPPLTQKPAALPPSSGGGSGKRVHDGFFLQLSLGAVYLHESWSPSAGGAGATYGGWGTSLEASVGKSVRPGLIVGGRWRFAAVIDPNESYLGVTTAASNTARFLDVVGAFLDYYPNPRRGLHVGGTVALLAATNVDTEYHAYETSWGPALSAHVGYEIFFSSHWSVGALAELSAYRYSTTEAGASSVSEGLLPTLAVAFTFN